MCEQRRMLKHGCAVLALVAPLLAIAACDATETGDEEYLTQKTGVASLAPEIGFGETVSGLIDKKQLDRYGMDLRPGDKITIAADALFDFDKAVLRPEGKKKLDEVAAKSKEIKLEVILAVGHTDRFGSVAYNMKLSDRRAAAVKSYLVSKGVDANRIYTEGKGPKNPVTKPDQCPGKKATKAVIQCLQPDRRVDIELIGTK